MDYNKIEKKWQEYWEKEKAVFYKNCAFCLETQGYPNACNIETFPSITLRKGEIYSAETKYKFSLYKA